MSSVVFLISCLLLATCSGSFVNKKRCRTVDSSLCDIHSVAVDPCPKGSSSCPVKTGKVYDISLQFTPHFTAEKLKYSIYGDVHNTGAFDVMFTGADDACVGLACPVSSEAMSDGHLPLLLQKTASGKFPVQVMWWNKYNATEACCFTFNVKVKK